MTCNAQSHKDQKMKISPHGKKKTNKKHFNKAKPLISPHTKPKLLQYILNQKELR